MYTAVTITTHLFLHEAATVYQVVKPPTSFDHFRRRLSGDASFGVVFCCNVEVDDHKEPPGMLCIGLATSVLEHDDRFCSSTLRTVGLEFEAGLPISGKLAPFSVINLTVRAWVSLMNTMSSEIFCGTFQECNVSGGSKR